MATIGKWERRKPRKTLRSNGSTLIETRFYMYPYEHKVLVDGELKTYTAWQCQVAYGDKKIEAHFQDKKHAELWIKDMKLNYKNVIMGTNYLAQYGTLVKQAEECLKNSNVMLETPMVGYYAVEADGSYAECKMLGVCNGIVFTKLGEEEKEHRVEDVFEELEHRSVFRLCDAVSKH